MGSGNPAAVRNPSRRAYACNQTATTHEFNPVGLAGQAADESGESGDKMGLGAVALAKRRRHTCRVPSDRVSLGSHRSNCPD
jgi:hypothetical protein